jgi:hypothetical protein
MLGKYGRGMTVKIPAKFQDANKNLVEVDNVILGIEYFDKNTNKIMNILNETKMDSRGAGDYIYEYTIPPNAEAGNYIVRIRAKHAGSKSNLIEATDYFEISHNMVLTPIIKIGEEKKEHKPAIREEQEDMVTVPAEKQTSVDSNGKRRVLVEDHIFDAYAHPIPGAHINVYDKNNFVPKSPNNIKVASALTNNDGRWSLTLLPGDYVFIFLAPNTRESREFRKIQ